MIIEIPDIDKDILYGILRDSLAEFINIRTPVKDYVKKRYPYMTEIEMESKMENVSLRLALAELLFDNLKIEEAIKK